VGVCLSGTVYDQVKNKLALGYEYLGEHTVKNIAEPVRVYRVAVPSPLVGEGQGEGAVGRSGAVHASHPDSFDLAQDRLPPPGGKEPQKPGRAGFARRKWALVTVTGLLLLAAILVVVRSLPWSLLGIRLSFFGTEEAPGLLLPLKPSIAVLPFANMSSDPEQDYFSDGMTDTLITDLSKLSGLFVIARNSTFAYKGKAITPQQVSHELGVRYVLEGSVQKAEARVRINAQLVDAATGQHVWAERYDREVKDIFALQDDLTRRIVSALQVRLTAEEQGRVEQVPTNNLEAYDYFLRGKEQGGRFTKEADAQARQLFQRAIALDPQFALAYLALGWTYIREWDWLWSTDPRGLDQALELAQKALTLNDSLAEAHSLVGIVYAQKGQSEQGLAEGERAIALDPNCAQCYASLAVILLMAERPEEALSLVEKAMRLDPESAAYHSSILGAAYRLLGRYEKAIADQKRALTRNPNYLYAHTNLAIIYNELGRVAEVQAEEAEVRRISPTFPLEFLRQKAALKAQKEDLDQFFKRSLTNNLKARAYFLGGFEYFLRWTREAQVQAQQMWRHAIELDREFAAAHTMLGWTYLIEWAFQWSQEPQALEQALMLARKAVALDETWPVAHQLLGLVYLYKMQHDRAIVEGEQAIALDPDDADGYRHLGSTLTFAGRPEAGVELLEKGIRLKPRLPTFHFASLGWAYYVTGRYEEALNTLQHALPLNPQWLPTHVYLAVVFSELGREEEARAAAAEVLRLSPNSSLEGMKQRLPFKDPAQTERVLAALRKAGLK
jgi:TolB-like protein/Flp pilus assembly protein TadD